jgi:hypothetical protein
MDKQEEEEEEEEEEEDRMTTNGAPFARIKETIALRFCVRSAGLA